MLCSEIQKIINSIWNKEEFPQQWKESIIVPFYKMGCSFHLFILFRHHLPQVRKFLNQLINKLSKKNLHCSYLNYLYNLN
jgi:hypothetical protein